MARPARKYPWLLIDGATLAGVDARLLRRLNALGGKLHQKITITSGYRSNAEQADLYRNAEKYGLVRGKTVAAPGHSRHETGLAVDATIDGQPIAKAVSAKMLASVGLSTPVANVGDYVHVELSGKAGKVASAPVAGAGAARGQGAPAPEFSQDYESRVAAATPDAQTPVSPQLPGAGLAPPGSVDIPYNPKRWAAETWQTLAAQSYASPDTLRLAEKARGLLDAS